MINQVNKAEYASWINDIKSKIRLARNKVALSVNSHLLELYWIIGKDVSEKQNKSEWGSNFIEQIAKDLKREFPEMTGFSRRNLYAIKQWYQFYSTTYEFVPQHVAQIPWGHNRLIISKIKDVEKAIFYAQETANEGWNRATLEIQIESNLFDRKGQSINNFEKTLSGNYSKIAIQALKNPYNLISLDCKIVR